jgi:chemotaxis protein methyltransferase CheR
MGYTRAECVAFLQWSLPQLRMRWQGFRKVRSQVCKRLRRRLAELDLDSLDAYRRFLADNPEEWQRLDAMCRITISRFYRDRDVMAAIGDSVLPELAAGAIADGRNELRCWSCGCASGEEPYTLMMLWHLQVGRATPGLALNLVATDADQVMLTRAQQGLFSDGSLRELPDELRQTGLQPAGVGLYRVCCAPHPPPLLATLHHPPLPHRVADRFRHGLTWLCQDVRHQLAGSRFDLILCRNLVFTYFDPALQVEIAGRLQSALRSGGALVLGKHEQLPAEVTGLAQWQAPHLRIYRKVS